MSTMVVEQSNENPANTTRWAGLLLVAMFFMAFAPGAALMYNLARTDPIAAVFHVVTGIAVVAALPWGALLVIHLRDSRRERQRSLTDIHSSTLLLAALTFLPIVTGIAAQSLVIGGAAALVFAGIGFPISLYLLVCSFRQMRTRQRPGVLPETTVDDQSSVTAPEPRRRTGKQQWLILAVAPLGAVATFAGLMATTDSNVLVQGTTGACLFVAAMAAVGSADIGGSVGMRRNQRMSILYLGSLAVGGAAAALLLSAWTATAA